MYEVDEIRSDRCGAGKGGEGREKEGGGEKGGEGREGGRWGYCVVFLFGIK